MKRLRQFLAWSPSRKRCFTAAVGVVTGLRLGLWLFPFRTVARAVLRARPRGSSPVAAEPAERATITWAVERANRFVPGRGACLHEALATHVLLRRRGFAPELRIGVRKGDAGEFRAHAWVEEGGEVVIGGTRAEVDRFVELKGLERVSF